MDNVAIVTGASRGLGKAIALALAENGFTPVVHYNKSRDEANGVLATLAKKGSDSFAVRADLRDEKGSLKMIDEVFGKFGRIDLLVNNAGNFLYKKFGETTNGEFCDIVESNLYSTLFTTRAALSIMRKQKYGNVVNIGAVGAERIQLREKSMPYFLAKTAVYTLTKAMAWEEARYGIRINMISPASLTVDIFKPADFPMGRSANYDDVIKTLLFLISEEAYYINGANIEVAGGFVVGMK